MPHSQNGLQESRSITAYNMMEKHALRKKLLAARKAMAPEDKAWRDKAIGERLLAWLEANPAACVGVYWPTQGEPDLTGVYQLLARRGIQLALPVVVGRDAPLEFHVWQPGDALVADAHGERAATAADTLPSSNRSSVLTPFAPTQLRWRRCGPNRARRRSRHRWCQSA